VAPLGAPVVSLGASGTSRTRVVGGSAAMRARARAILDGMGDVAIAEIRFGRPPEAFARFRRTNRPIWLSTTVVLVGAEINAEMEHQTARDTTVRPEKPMGARGARMADTVGEAKS